MGHAGMREDVMIFHQAKQDECNQFVSSLSRLQQWPSALVTAGLSGGFLVVIGKLGTGCAFACRHVAPPLDLRCLHEEPCMHQLN